MRRNRQVRIDEHNRNIKKINKKVKRWKFFRAIKPVTIFSLKAFTVGSILFAITGVFLPFFGPVLGTGLAVGSAFTSMIVRNRFEIIDVDNHIDNLNYDIRKEREGIEEIEQDHKNQNEQFEFDFDENNQQKGAPVRPVNGGRGNNNTPNDGRGF
jgi:hypothetical protein